MKWISISGRGLDLKFQPMVKYVENQMNERWWFKIAAKSKDQMSFFLRTSNCTALYERFHILKRPSSNRGGYIYISLIHSHAIAMVNKTAREYVGAIVPTTRSNFSNMGAFFIFYLELTLTSLALQCLEYLPLSFTWIFQVFSSSGLSFWPFFGLVINILVISFLNC